jgi:hypothetical protein
MDDSALVFGMPERTQQMEMPHDRRSTMTTHALYQPKPGLFARVIEELSVFLTEVAKVSARNAEPAYFGL